MERPCQAGCGGAAAGSPTRRTSRVQVLDGQFVGGMGKLDSWCVEQLTARVGVSGAPSMVPAARSGDPWGSCCPSRPRRTAHSIPVADAGRCLTPILELASPSSGARARRRRPLVGTGGSRGYERDPAVKPSTCHGCADGPLTGDDPMDSATDSVIPPPGAEVIEWAGRTPALRSLDRLTAGLSPKASTCAMPRACLRGENGNFARPG